MGLASPYSLAIKSTLDNRSAALNQESQSSLHYCLCNLVQGRLLEYLVSRIQHRYELFEDTVQKNLSAALADIFQEEFCPQFRHRVEENPQILIGISERIVDIDETVIIDWSRIDYRYWHVLKLALGHQDAVRILGIIKRDRRITRMIAREKLKNGLHSLAEIRNFIKDFRNFRLMFGFSDNKRPKSTHASL